MRLIYRPIDAWPGELTRESARKTSPFFATWTDTLDLLAREVDMLRRSSDPDEVVLQIAGSERDMRLDGGLRSTARPSHPGVIVSFVSRFGPLRYHTDVFASSQKWMKGLGGGSGGYREIPGWQANVRAVALGLEALRKVDRYGIATDGQQYTGWNALPAGRPMGAGMTVEEAAQFIASYSFDPEGRLPEVAEDPSFALALYKEAAKVLHPDAGGDPALFRKLTDARDLLEASV